ncbi:unnamed protein product [Mytilus coruscus]|uniref:Uncharacterized protein n=1 Tax=Mytilus coruscus TaxID=42192 RepID=A0A6J8BV62_MYTCO|nr:unnamed protein product [Mytilus coruscus]
MKDTQQCSKENKMKVKNEENQAVVAEKENQADSFEKKNNLSGITMIKEEHKEGKEVNCLGDNPVAVNCKGDNPDVVNCKGDNQVTERKISNEELDDLTSKVSDIQIADKKEVVGRQNTVEEDTKRPRNQTSLDNDEEVQKREGALTARGPNGGRASSCDNTGYNYYATQPEYKLGSNNNKRSFSEETEPAKYYKPVVDYFPSQSHVNVKQLGGGTVTLKTPPIQHQNEPPYTFDSIPEGGDLIDALLAEQGQSQLQNIRADFSPSNIPVNMEPTNIFPPKHVKEENVIIDENSSSPYTNGGPPSNQSDSGISGMSYGSPYQNLSSPQSNASPPHVPEMGYPPVMNAPQYSDVLDLMDPIAGREEDFQDVQKMIAADLLRDNKPPSRVREQIRPEIPHNHMMANQMNLINIKPQPQHFQMNTPHCPISTHSTMQQQATIFGHAPMSTNNIILPPCSQPSAVVQPIPVSNPVMMVPPQGPIPIGPVTPFTQPQIIIIQPGPIQAQRRPALRNIAPKTDKQTNKKPVQGPLANKGQKQPPRPDPVPVMQVRPTPSQLPNNAQQRPQNNQNNAQKRNLLNIARRMVAEIPSEQLRHQDDEGDTYLHVAACKSDPNLIQSLLERLNREQMDWLIDLENKKRMTPLYLAVLGNQPEMVEIFLKNNADPNALAQSASSPTEGKSLEVKAPIHVASAGGEESLPTLKKLLSVKDISLNIYNSEGHTALHTAIIAHGTKRQNGSYINSLNTIEALIKAGADPNSQDKKSGKTPLMYAIEKRDCILIEKMLRLFDPKKLRNVIKSSTFDGSNCLKIAEGRKSEFNPQEWQRLWDLLNKACTGELPRTVMLGY